MIALQGLTRHYQVGDQIVRALQDVDLTIPDDEAEKLKTVGEAIDYIKNKLTVKT